MMLSAVCPNCGYANEDGALICAECECDLEDMDPEALESTQMPKTPPRGNGGGRPTPPPSSASAPQASRGSKASTSAPEDSSAPSASPPVQKWRQTVSKPIEMDPVEMESGEDQGPDNRVSCSNCGRLFAPDVIGKHENVCNRQKKRPVFNSKKHRAEGTELAEFKPPPGSGYSSSPSKAQPKPAVSKWKQQSEDFRNAMKASRAVEVAMKTGGPLPPPVYSENAHYIPCPHCGRKFAPDVAERHIPKCSSTVNRPKPPPKRR